MTPRQRIAFRLPCARAWDALAPELAEWVRTKGETWSTVLSVNK